jgi:uncharacterized protein (TIGR02453 family)
LDQRTVGRAMTATTDRFTGWAAEGPAFLADLEVNNTREWWTANKRRYDADVLAPLQLLGTAVRDEFGVMSIKRPHRDVRFSADKSPYKTTIAGGIDTPGAMLLGVQLSATELSVVAGHFELAPDQLTRFRDAVVAERTGQEFEKRIDALAKKGYELQSFTALKGVAKGYPKDHPRARFLGLKGMHVGRAWTADALPHGAQAAKVITTPWRDAEPLLDFLAEHVGPSTLPQRFSPRS